MRFTKLGRDFHVAILVLAATGLLEAQELFAGLALALAFSSMLSAVMLGTADPANSGIRASKPVVRAFKGESGRVGLVFPSRPGRWVGGEVVSARVDGAGDGEECDFDAEKMEMTFRLKVSGRFGGLVLGLKLKDALGIFEKSVGEVRVPVVIDSLPVSLLHRTRLPYVSPLVLGESPGGMAGRGQEFYGMEEYNERSESKDIMWKRAARTPDSPLLARVRESNIPERVTLNVVHGEVAEGERPKLVDLQCEALGALGSSVLVSGVDVGILAPDGRSVGAEDEEALAMGIMEASAAAGTEARSPEDLPSSILVLVGKPREKWSTLVLRVPEVLIGSGAPTVSDFRVATFSGFEDLTPLVGQVLSS